VVTFCPESTEVSCGSRRKNVKVKTTERLLRTAVLLLLHHSTYTVRNYETAKRRNFTSQTPSCTSVILKKAEKLEKTVKLVKLRIGFVSASSQVQ
jgi:hypothetical protein